MKKKILFIVNVDWFFISHRLPLAIKAIENGYEVHLACNYSKSKEFLEKKGIACHEIQFTRSNYNIMNALIICKQIHALLKDIKPDITHLVTIKPILLGGIVARLLKLPSVVFAISGLGYIFISKGKIASIRKRMIGLIYAYVFKHKNICVIFQNTDDQNELSKLSGLNKIHSVIIPGSGVDTERFSISQLPKSPPVIMMASRLLKDKGVYEYISAARIIGHKNKNIKFVLVGTPDPENPSSISIEEVNGWIDKGYIEYWGQQEDMPNVISKSTIVVLPSYREGLPKVLLEASSSGRPVITTNVAGCRDAIIDMRTGFLVEKYNAQDLADKIVTLSSNLDRCIQMGQSGRKLVEEKFSEKLIVSHHMKVYEKLLLEQK
jgi:glycosyltransferase involved in cell wall biosynthesis